MNEIDKLIARLGWQIGQQDIAIQQLTNRIQVLQQLIEDMKQQAATAPVEVNQHEG